MTLTHASANNPTTNPTRQARCICGATCSAPSATCTPTGYVSHFRCENGGRWDEEVILAQLAHECGPLCPEHGDPRDTSMATPPAVAAEFDRLEALNGRRPRFVVQAPTAADRKRFDR